MTNKKEEKEEKGASFWTTLPGIMMGCAAIISAIAGLITAVVILWPKEPENSGTPTLPPVVINQPTLIPPTNPPVQAAPSATHALPTSTQYVPPTLTPLPLALFDILDVTSGRTYFTDILIPGAIVYTDREYVYRDVPAFLQGQEYIITANEDKFGGRVNINFQLILQANRDVIVYVAHSDRYPNKPNWLYDFQDTNADLTFLVDNDLIYLSVYQKAFPAGQIVLGGNNQPTETENNAMYTVVIAGN
ncbi:MAG: hypothetical protein IT314_17080 [Anaerolineales bacterium]|nr:hypothetical protein [Anaerolineales bacterium]